MQLNLQQRIEIFAALGEKIAHQLQENAPEMESLISQAKSINPWFTVDNIEFALSEWSGMLQTDTLKEFMANYPENSFAGGKKIGVIMAGNIPLVGFHDFLCVILSGNHCIAKCATADSVLLPTLAKWMVEINPKIQDYFSFEERLKNFDAVIATGSNNSARYFEYYFGKVPHIIRKNRSSVAVLNGFETQEDLQNLGKDIFTYFGLGCRNVSHLFIPEGYEFEPLLEAFNHYEEIRNHNKYFNNYEYQYAAFLVNRIPHKSNGFVLLREHDAISSPIASLHYSYYKDLADVKQKLQILKEEIQVIVSLNAFIPNSFPLGSSQLPTLTDFADGVNTLDFLMW